MSTLGEDLMRLRELKRDAEQKYREKVDADTEFKRFQAKTIDRMIAEGSKGWTSDQGVAFTRVDKVKGNVTDRRPFVRWALEQDEDVQDFLQELIYYMRDYKPDEQAAFIERFYQVVMNTGLVEYKPNQGELNRIAAACVDDERDTPPGFDWRPDHTIQQRSS